MVIKFEDLNQQDKILSCNKKHTIIMHSLKELNSQTWSKNGRQRWAIMFSRPFFVAMQRLWNPCHAEPQNEQCTLESRVSESFCKSTSQGFTHSRPISLECPNAN